MGKKYLDTKKNSLEQSVLGVWKKGVEEGTARMDGRTSQYREHRKKLESARERKQNIKTESYEIGTDEYRKYIERLTPGEAIEEKSGGKEAYKKFFDSALKKFGIKSPAELKDDDEKKKFYDYIDKNWTGDHEEAFEFAKESKVSSIIDTVKNMWSMDEKTKKEDDDKEITGGKTLTGKKSASIEINPDIEEKQHKKKVHSSKTY
jgi:hypothetical protein